VDIKGILTRQVILRAMAARPGAVSPRPINSRRGSLPAAQHRNQYDLPLARQFGFGKDKVSNLIAVQIADERGDCDTDAVLQNVLPISSGAVAADPADGRRVLAPPGSDPEVVRHTIAQREEDARC
jgi:hypothetical protein